MKLNKLSQLAAVVLEGVIIRAELGEGELDRQELAVVLIRSMAVVDKGLK
jgi:hypothetical protein